jgi:hypothetical protein
MPGRSTSIGAVDGAATRIGLHQIRLRAQQVEAKVLRPISPGHARDRLDTGIQGRAIAARNASSRT